MVLTGTALILGISGGTGSGKTTIANAIVDRLPEGAVSLIQHDAYYRDLTELTDEQREQINFDHPDSLDNDLLVEHLDMLRRGEEIPRPNYDFVTHKRQKKTTAIQPAPVLVLEGILLFTDPRLVEQCDVKLFVDTPADIRILRRIRRDTEKRGRTFEEVRSQYYETVRPMHLSFVEPTRRLADLIIPEGGNKAVAIDVIIERIRRQLREVAWPVED